MQFRDIVALAWQTVKVNKLRTGITIGIIALGITALVGILTAITAMNQSLRESFSTMGANGFSIRFKDRNFFMGGNQSNVEKTSKKSLKQRRSNLDKIISHEEALRFKNNYKFPATVSISNRGNFASLLQYVTESKTYKTNPNVSFQGGDENYLALNGYELQGGRNFTLNDIQSGSNVVIIGNNVVDKLFEGNSEKALEKTIKINDRPYLVIGVLKQKGSSAFMNLDNVAITSYNNIRQISGRSSFSIGVMVDDVRMVDHAAGEATGLMRNIRKLDFREEENFVIDKSDALAEQFIGFLAGITGAAGVIGFITLFGAAIALMNIMLVAVTERTKEIGLSKAIGAPSSAIRKQFLYESVIISLLGAAFGIFFGIIIGNLFAMLLKTGFVLPWLWVLLGISMCFITGLIAGLYPAVKAAKLDPIDALRYE